MGSGEQDAMQGHFMLISYSHRFILIHVPKTGGSSIRDVMSPFCFEAHNHLINRLQRRIGINLKIPYYKWRDVPYHSTALETKAALPDRVYNDFFTFAFVRNPWDWLVSHYHYILKSPGRTDFDLVAGMAGYDEYVAYFVNEVGSLQRDFVADQNGTILVDYLGKFENLAEDFRYVCQKVSLNLELPHVNKSRHKNYRSYYENQITRDRFDKHFQEDIEMFGYSF